ncbi:MAG: glycosyltransferase family 2 protein [Sutterellaceae bacterium]|nr:glycosyltransferase family 2 protein [Burkholderiaceae bacterium]MCX7901112.1 glycosyltransferase family 2 protein [Burkholderiaceae bacterium]MDW8429570.1 glycosyltransferase family 2 protein [Sutterellaceae bacterium]
MTHAEAPVVDVIIPTLATANRSFCLRRAIESVRTQSSVRTRILVVINGTSFCDALASAVAALPSVCVLHIHEASLPAALRAGRAAVTAPFFGFLDDDDELLPNALIKRVAYLNAVAQADVVISNGARYVSDHTQPTPIVQHATRIYEDPLAALLEFNWFSTSASGLYRTSSISLAAFAGIPKYLEWTYLGVYLLTSGRVVHFLDEIQYAKYEAATSLSRSLEYTLGMPSALEQILELDLPSYAKRTLLRKRCTALHTAADIYLKHGLLGRAWKSHLRSIASPHGLRYLAFTRYLIKESAISLLQAL